MLLTFFSIQRNAPLSSSLLCCELSLALPLSLTFSSSPALIFRIKESHFIEGGGNQGSVSPSSLTTVTLLSGVPFFLHRSLPVLSSPSFCPPLAATLFFHFSPHPTFDSLILLSHPPSHLHQSKRPSLWVNSSLLFPLILLLSFRQDAAASLADSLFVFTLLLYSFFLHFCGNNFCSRKSLPSLFSLQILFFIFCWQ